MIMLKAIEKNDLVVKRSRSGLGLFPKINIPKDSFVIEYTGRLLPTNKADDMGGRYLFRINSKWTVDGKERKNISRYINHSCKPNCLVKISNNRILIYSAKNIIAGEELNYDYGKEYFEEFIKPIGCKCSHCIRKS